MSGATFWCDFAQAADDWAQKMRLGSQREVFDAIDALLEVNELPYCFDVTTDECNCLLVFSPEGDLDAAERIDELVRSAPSLDSWRVLGRRQRKSLEDAAAIVRSLYFVDPRDLRFRTYQKDTAKIVEMFVGPNADLSAGEAQGMINTFLWHAIGEDSVIEHEIKGVVFFRDPPKPAISALDLVAIASKW